MHFESSGRLKAGPIQMLVNCRVKECRGIVGLIVVGVDNTVGCFFGGVGGKECENVVSLFNG